MEGKSTQMQLLLLLSVLGLYIGSHAHIQMSWPPAIRSRFNPYSTDIDYDMTNPLLPDGTNYPCKGYQALLDTPQGQSVVTWLPGQTYNFTLAGSATHAGGSCQVSVSFDRGKTWTVLHSYIGQCPLTPSWNFKLPNDTPSGSALFAWSWFNNVGNREMYMNCAHVTIAQGDDVQLDPEESFNSRPSIFAANIGNGCDVIEGYDLIFPQPGPEVSFDSLKAAPPVGSCSAK